MKLDTNTLIIAGVIFASVYLLSFVAYIMFRRYLEFRKMEFKAGREMDAVRQHLETKLIEMNERLLTSETRWRDANHLILSSQSHVRDLDVTEQTPSSGGFLSNYNLSAEQQKIDSKLVFVLMPFLPEMAPIFECIAAVCRRAGLECRRGDEEYIKGELFPHILKQIVQARLIIADISGRNPNVFYELGVAHALDKPTIVICHRKHDVPIDMRTKYLLLYSDPIDLRNELRELLTRVLAAEQNR